MTVNFVTDSSVPAPGFKLTYEEVPFECGGHIYLTADITSGTFTSPHYPNYYPPNLDCVWIITAPANERIRVDFKDSFSIENHSKLVIGLHLLKLQV